MPRPRKKPANKGAVTAVNRKALVDYKRSLGVSDCPACRGSGTGRDGVSECPACVGESTQ